MKICSKCKESKSFDDFYKDKSRPDGHQYYCKLCSGNFTSKYYAENVDKMKEKHNSYNHTDKAKLMRKNYKINNPGKVNASYAKRRAAKIRATPSWLTKDQLNEIEQFYTEAKELRWLSEKDLHVDHIIPLLGKNVCGLHVPWNLQILPENLNLKKSNKV